MKVGENIKARLKKQRDVSPIVEAVPSHLILEELARTKVIYELSSENSDRGFRVFFAQGNTIPNTLRELGRLREITFRKVGEGTGKEIDLDRFDPYYFHLITFDKELKQIAGAYRLGLVHDIIQTHGTKGLYTAQFFEYAQLLEGPLSHAVELGRSFVVPEYQKKPFPFMSLWGGIGQFLVQNTQYKDLIGAVSIGNDYKRKSKKLLINYLMKYHRSEKANVVSAHHPPLYSSLAANLLSVMTTIVKSRLGISSELRISIKKILEDENNPPHIKEIDELISRIEDDAKKKSPPLIGIYLKLQAKFLAFDVDKDFNTVDGLIWTDVSQVPYDTLKKYLGDEGARTYLEAQAPVN